MLQIFKMPDHQNEKLQLNQGPDYQEFKKYEARVHMQMLHT